MPRLFGTDGIRGVANVDLKPSTAFALGRATAHHLVGPGGSIVVGQDTRRSGDMFVAAIAAGATSLGVTVNVVGVVPTPALAFLVADGDDAAGVMVSASHNPAEDNGLKVLDSDGLKLDDAVEDELEALIWRSDELAGVAPDQLGTVRDARDRLGRYLGHRERLAGALDASGLHIVVDAANGSASAVAGRIIGATGARVEVINDRPDGWNINLQWGATDPAGLATRVAETGADLGFALDGDADRLVAVDGAGRVVDGDRVLGVLALDRLSRNGLDADDPTVSTLVVSVLSNGGLQLAVEGAGGT
ncbi:MAG: phosphoglucosamine mutase, partial [Chloroflexi bacterium]|nr:phosphoglucosamine mutase [Chloroflexota bacterium]